MILFELFRQITQYATTAEMQAAFDYRDATAASHSARICQK